MDAVLGLLGMLVYAACIIGLAAGITWIVVKVSPSEKPEKPAADEAASS
jgi:hypothetical protein